MRIGTVVATRQVDYVGFILAGDEGSYLKLDEEFLLKNQSKTDEIFGKEFGFAARINQSINLGKFLGHGAARWAFEHPEDSSKVIKIDRWAVYNKLNNKTHESQTETEYRAYQNIVKYCPDFTKYLAKVLFAGQDHILSVQERMPCSVAQWRAKLETQAERVALDQKFYDWMQELNREADKHGGYACDIFDANVGYDGETFKVIDLGCFQSFAHKEFKGTNNGTSCKRSTVDGGRADEIKLQPGNFIVAAGAKLCGSPLRLVQKPLEGLRAGDIIAGGCVQRHDLVRNRSFFRKIFG